MAIVGDSVSELETKSVVHLCIGFGGFVPRAAVKEQADIFLLHPSFAPFLPIILNCQIWETLRYHPQHRTAMKRGFEILRTVQFNYHTLEFGENLLARAHALPLEMFDENYPVPPVWKGY